MRILRQSRKIFILVLLFVATVINTVPVQALDEQFGIGNGIFYYNPDEGCLTTTSSFNSTVTVIQANIKYNIRAGVRELITKSPDFVSLNEVGSGSKDDLTPPGYSMYRDESSKGQARGTAVLWNNRWTKVDAGRVLIVPDGPQEWDPGRSITWVTLTDNAGNTGSMISLHHMINPAKYGPNMPLRQELYKKGLETVVEKVKELSTKGPVFLAGDFNSQYSANDPWGPRKVLGTINMVSTFDELGPIQTHKGGGTIDYIFHTSETKAVDQYTIKSEHSDHYFLVAQLQSTTPSGGVEGGDAKITGSDNAEKAWNYLKGQGLSDEQTAGIIGNLMAESGLDPKAKNGSNYYGIAQWDSVNRWGRLKEFAKSKGLDEWSFEAQIQFLWKEASDRGNIKGLKEYPQQDVSHLAWYWGRYFEVAIISGDPDKYPYNVQHFKDAREPAAEKIYKQLTGKSAGAAPAPEAGAEGDATCSADGGSTDDSGAGGAPDADIGAGKGSFSDSGEVAGWETVKANSILVDKVWGDKLEWNGWCASIVARTWQGSASTGFGYSPHYAMTLWENYRNLVHTDHKPKKGSILIYTGGTVYGHVTIYLGNNKILNDGHIVDATTKAEDYLGWVDPNDLTWQKPHKLTDVGFMSKYQ